MVDTISAMEPDFVVHCGDISGHCDLENFDAGLRIMDRLPCPWYAVIGNHDTWFPGVRDAFSDRHGLPRGQCFYSVSLHGLCFMFLDTCYWRALDGAVSPYLNKELFENDMIDGLYVADGELEWLGAELETRREEAVVLVSHAPLGFKDVYPVTTLPDGSPGPKGGCSLLQFNRKCGRIGDVVNRLELRRLLAGHSNVKAALAGHCHINDFHEEDGIAFIQTGAMREYPFEFRVVQVEDDVASVTTHGLNNPCFQVESYIEQRGNRWVAGTDAERTFTIPL
jgi:3',5'-cyclic AMP phosphodiesterase CpdA